MLSQSFLVQFQYTTEWTLAHSMIWASDCSYTSEVLHAFDNGGAVVKCMIPYIYSFFHLTLIANSYSNAPEELRVRDFVQQKGLIFLDNVAILSSFSDDNQAVCRILI